MRPEIDKGRRLRSDSSVPTKFLGKAVATMPSSNPKPLPPDVELTPGARKILEAADAMLLAPAIGLLEHVKKVEQKIEYLNSVDTTIMGSRNGQAALYLWYSLRKKGIAGIKRDVV